LCISLSSRPSNFGTTIHNAAYKELGLNYIYKAFRTENLKGAIEGVRSLGIKGCSVSMPFKEAVIPYLDKLDPLAKSVGAVNTVLNVDGILKGFNTDVIAAIKSLKAIGFNKEDRVLLLGAGGVAKAILGALKMNGANEIYIANRTEARLEKLKKISDFSAVSWIKRTEFTADIIINATSVGMHPSKNISPMPISSLEECKAVIDVVVSPYRSKIIEEAANMKKITFPGYKLSLEQAAAQFEIYTEKNAPVEFMERKIEEHLKR
jgi:shikimate dehydrogenase